MLIQIFYKSKSFFVVSLKESLRVKLEVYDIHEFLITLLSFFIALSHVDLKEVGIWEFLLESFEKQKQSLKVWGGRISEIVFKESTSQSALKVLGIGIKDLSERCLVLS